MRPHTVWSSVMTVVGIATVTASGPRPYPFVSLTMKADAAIIASSIQREGKVLEISVKSVVFGEISQQVLKVPFRPVRYGAAIDKIDAERLVFLSRKGEGYILVGAGLQSLWPQARRSAVSHTYYCPYDSAEVLSVLSKTAERLKSFKGLDELARSELLREMFDGRDPFLRYCGILLCAHLHRARAAGYRRDVEMGAAYALEHLQNSIRGDECTFLDGADLAVAAAPPSVAWNGLRRLMDHPLLSTRRQINIRARILGIAGKFGSPEIRKLLSELAPEEERFRLAEGWFSKSSSRLIKADSGRIMGALRSEQLPRRRVGRIWLEALAGRSLGFNEVADADDRAAALSRVQAWFREMTKE